MSPPDVDELFQAALAKHRAGDLSGAMAGYQAVLDLEAAHGPSHQNLSLILRRLGRLPEALESADTAVALRPDKSGGHNARGRALIDLGRPAEALLSFDRAVAVAPADAIGHQNRGAALRTLDRFVEALTAFEQALELAPQNPGLHLDRGAALMSLERASEAADAFGLAAQLQPRGLEAHRNLAIALRSSGRFEEAQASVERALALAPRDAGLHNLLGRILFSRQAWSASVAAYDSALALQPDMSHAHNGRGSALMAMGRPEDALQAYDLAIATDPNLAAAHRNRGVVLRRLGKPEAALEAQDRAIALQPDQAEAYWNRGLCHLVLRRFEEGWRDYARRWEVDEFLSKAAANVPPDLRARLSRDVRLEDVVGRDVLLVGEQGVGDVIMFASALPDLLRIAGRVALACDTRLRRLFAESFPGLTLLSLPEAQAQAEGFAVTMGIGSLAALFRNREADFPGTPYLRPKAQAVAAWAERLGSAEGRKRVGISWRGGLANTERSARSLDLAALRPVLDLPGCEFVNLQYGDVAAEVAAVNSTDPEKVRLFPAKMIDDFEDLSALVLNLDLVISVQTTLVHLSGAVGAPALVMVPATPEWRYTTEGTSMPWYRSVRLFRQSPDRNWRPVIEAVAAEARRRLDLI